MDIASGADKAAIPLILTEGLFAVLSEFRTLSEPILNFSVELCYGPVKLQELEILEQSLLPQPGLQLY
jgi:hypothetical protein